MKKRTGNVRREKVERRYHDRRDDEERRTVPCEALVKKILVTGQPWGALEELLLGQKINPGLTFTLPAKGDATYPEAAPWIELLQTGTFSTETLSRLPVSYQTTDAWLAKLEESAEKFGMTWLHALYISIAYIERGAIEYPLQLLGKSMALKPTPIASRCLAVLQSTPEAAWPLFEQAWTISQRDFTADPSYGRITLNLITENRWTRSPRW